MIEESHEARIRRARDSSNRAIARRDVRGVGESLGEDYVGVIGDGTLVPSRSLYLQLFQQGFDSGADCMTYVRTPEAVEVAEDASLAAERGAWVASLPDGWVAYTGTYAAMWRRTRAGWKIRSEMFVTLRG